MCKCNEKVKITANRSYKREVGLVGDIPNLIEKLNFLEHNNPLSLHKELRKELERDKNKIRNYSKIKKYIEDEYSKYYTQ